MNSTELKNYFENSSGLAVLSTSNSSGEVNSAVYGKPHFTGENEIAFIMNDRRSHSHLQSNPNAAYLFVEEGSKSKGIRLYLKKISETDDNAEIEKIRRHHSKDDSSAEKKRFLVKFFIVDTRPIIDKESF